MLHLKIPFVKNSELAKMPARATEGSSGYDLYASEAVNLGPGERSLINTGIILAIPNGYEGQIRSRSGLAAKHGVTVLNSPGTIDSDYRGELKVLLYNSGKEVFSIEIGMRIAQLVISQYSVCDFNLVSDLNDTGRGAGGFGSTGQN